MKFGSTGFVIFGHRSSNTFPARKPPHAPPRGYAQGPPPHEVLDELHIPGRTASIAALAAALSLAGCAQYAAVAEKRPRFMPNPVGLGVLQGAEKAITNALRRDRREPLAALGEYLTAAEAAGATTPAQSRADLVEWARSAMLIEGSELASDVDFEIPRCVNTIEETVGLIRENRASWLASEQGK